METTNVEPLNVFVVSVDASYWVVYDDFLNAGFVENGEGEVGEIETEGGEGESRER